MPGSSATQQQTPDPRTAVDTDVAIIGGGISGISAAYYVGRNCPRGTSYTLVEGRAQLGGTWDLFRYPGIRSDSDMYSFSFGFRPWRSPQRFGSGADIRAYLQETAAALGMESRLRLSTTVVAADWDSARGVWVLTLGRTHEEHRGAAPGHRPDAAAPKVVPGSEHTLTARYIIAGTGYYSYDDPQAPAFPGQERFIGQIIHPQFWDPATAVAGRRVVVIGSGATAVTIVPAVAKQGAASTVMLQRTPSYLGFVPDKSGFYSFAMKLAIVLPMHWAITIARTLHILESYLLFKILRRFPELGKKRIADGWLMAFGGDKALLERQRPHLTPPYQPWDQRICAMPEGDLLREVKEKRVEIVTDTIKTFTETGIELTSGRVLEADIIVPATGLQLVACGGLPVTVDGVATPNGDRYMYRSGAMTCDVPNYFSIMGYLNGSWATKADLVAYYAARVITQAETARAAYVVPRIPVEQRATRERMTGHFSSGYIQRAIAANQVPYQGASDPFRVHQDYLLDYQALVFGSVTEKHLVYASSASA